MDTRELFSGLHVQVKYKHGPYHKGLRAAGNVSVDPSPVTRRGFFCGQAEVNFWRQNNEAHPT